MNNGIGKKKKAERACRPCRELKVRCLPCVERDDICQKCRRSGAPCIFEGPRPGKKRKAVSDFEEESSLREEQNDANLQRPGSSAPGISLGAATGCPTSGTTLYKDSSSHGYSDCSTVTAPTHGDVPKVEYLFETGILAPDRVASYLSRYQKMCAYFPFAPIPEDASLEELTANQPFTLRSILVISSGDDKNLQRTLERSFRDRVLQTVMIDGERSIDLLLSLIIYLAWYHFFYIPMKQQFYQTLQIAISLCVDMKLDRPPEKAALTTFGQGACDGDHLLLDATSDRFYSRSARRAYVGCYCISTATSWVWCKPSNFPCSNYLLRCARSLSGSPEYATDTLILPLLETQISGNDQHRAFTLPTFDSSDHSTQIQMCVELNRFEERLSRIQRKEDSDCVLLNLSRLYAASYGVEMNLLNPCNGPPSGKSAERMPLITSRRECLMFCLRSASKAFEAFLELPIDDYPVLSVMQWWALVCNTAYLYRLCLGIPQIPEWDVKVARDTTKLEIYLDLLCYRLERATQSTLDKLVGRDLYSLLGPIFTNVKRSYERLKKLPKALSANDKQPVHVSAFEEGCEDNGRKSTTRPSRCPAFRYVSRAEEIGLGPAGDDGESNGLPEMSDLDIFLNSGLFEGDTTWLGEMPPSNSNLFDMDFFVTQ